MAGNYVGVESSRNNMSMNMNMNMNVNMNVNMNSANNNLDLQRIQMLKAVKTQFYIHKSFDIQSDMEFLPSIANEFDGGLSKLNNGIGINRLNSPVTHMVNPYQHQMSTNMQSLSINDLMKSNLKANINNNNSNSTANGTNSGYYNRGTNNMFAVNNGMNSNTDYANGDNLATNRLNSFTSNYNNNNNHNNNTNNGNNGNGNNNNGNGGSGFRNANNNNNNNNNNNSSNINNRVVNVGHGNYDSSMYRSPLGQPVNIRKKASPAHNVNVNEQHNFPNRSRNY